jgi:hypothetical protein
MSVASTIVTSDPARSLTGADRAARLLGWFGLGLGLAELIAPNRITEAIGLEGKEGLVRAYGARQVAAGMTSLAVEADVGVWSRVAGDLLDIGTIAYAMQDADQRQKRNAGIALAAVVGITLIDALVASQLSRQRSRHRGKVRDYSDRSGFPGGIEAARGGASDFVTPPDYRAAPALASASS